MLFELRGVDAQIIANTKKNDPMPGLRYAIAFSLHHIIRRLLRFGAHQGMDSITGFFDVSANHAKHTFIMKLRRKDALDVFHHEDFRLDFVQELKIALVESLLFIGLK